MSPFNAAIKEVPFANFVTEMALIWRYKPMESFDEKKANWKLYFESIGFLVTLFLLINFLLPDSMKLSELKVKQPIFTTIQLLCTQLLFAVGFSVAHFVVMFQKFKTFKAAFERFGVWLHQHLRLAIFIIMLGAPIHALIETPVQVGKSSIYIINYAEPILMIVGILIFFIYVIGLWRTVYKAVGTRYERSSSPLKVVLSFIVLGLGLAFISAAQSLIPILNT